MGFLAHSGIELAESLFGPVEERVEYSRCDSNKPTEVLAEEFLLLAEDSKDTAHTTAGRIGLRKQASEPFITRSNRNDNSCRRCHSKRSLLRSFYVPIPNGSFR
jgi:hypothetical protein